LAPPHRPCRSVNSPNSLMPCDALSIDIKRGEFFSCLDLLGAAKPRCCGSSGGFETLTSGRAHAAGLMGAYSVAMRPLPTIPDQELAIFHSTAGQQLMITSPVRTGTLRYGIKRTAQTDDSKPRKDARKSLVPFTAQIPPRRREDRRPPRVPAAPHRALSHAGPPIPAPSGRRTSSRRPPADAGCPARPS
jgi:hypothetical protein